MQNQTDRMTKKNKPTEGQKRAKNRKEAQWNQWASLFIFAMGLLFLCFTLRSWQSKPSLSVGFEVLSACGFLLAGAFLRAEAKETLRRNGEKHDSVGYQVSYLLAFLCHLFGEGKFPLAFLPWLLSFWAAATLAVFAWLTLRLRTIRRTKAQKAFAPK